MAMIIRGRRRRLVLDLGASAVRLCELSQTKTGYQLTKYFQREFNPDPQLDEEARKNLKRKALAEVLKLAKTRTRRTIFGLPGQSVFTRNRALPPVPEYKVNQIVKYEIQQQIPFALDQIAMDYQVLDRTEAGGYEVMMAAIKVDVVDKHIQLIFDAKRQVDIVDVSPLAAYNWLKHTGEFGDQGECVALIDLGASTTDLVIERESQFRFTRSLNLGGNDITLALAAAFGLNFSDAERLKRERAFAPTGDPQRDGKGGEAIGPILQRLVSEIMRSFAYFRSLPGGGQVNRVILCGGGACLRNIIPFMQRQLGIDVRIAQPLAGLAIGPGAQQVSDTPEQACVVLGLALRSCETVPLEINLVPPRVLEAARRKEQVFYWALSLATLALIMASIIPVKANENRAVLERVETLKSVIRQFDPEVVNKVRPGMPPPQSQDVNNLQLAQNNIKRIQGQVQALDLARTQQAFWLDELSMVNLARITASGRMWFSNIATTQLTPAGGGGEGGRAGRGGGGARPGGERPGSMRGGGGPGAGATPGFNSTGFPGIDARGGGGGLRGRGGDESEPRAGGARRGGGAEAQAAVIPRANGLSVQGFAESDAIIKDFVATLGKSEESLPDGRILRVKNVVFSEASVERVPWEILYDACGFSTSGGRSGNRTTDPGIINPNASSGLYSFRVEVEFEKGYAADLTAASKPSGNPPPQ